MTATIPSTVRTIALPATLERIVLTGFMGAGKTSVGRLLAELLGWQFLSISTTIWRRVPASPSRSYFSRTGRRTSGGWNLQRSPTPLPAPVSCLRWVAARRSSSPIACCWSKHQARRSFSWAHPSRSCLTGACCRVLRRRSSRGLCSLLLARRKRYSPPASRCTVASPGSPLMSRPHRLPKLRTQSSPDCS